MQQNSPLKFLLLTLPFCAGLITLGKENSATEQVSTEGNDAKHNADLSAGRLHFSLQPTELELSSARVFDEPLVPLGGKPSAAENKALANALASYASRGNLDDFSSLTSFLDTFPNSGWCGSLLLHLGVEYYSYGYYSKALDTWEQAWKQCESIQDPKGKAQTDRALGELARMYSKLGRTVELERLLQTTKDRDLHGPGTQLIAAAKDALWMMQNRPEFCFRCGPLALDLILSHNDPAKAGQPDRKSTRLNS